MNTFEEINFNLNNLYEKAVDFSARKITPKKRFFLINYFYLFFSGLTVKLGIRKRLALGNWTLGWFDEFNDFWKEILEGRPIDPLDFHFLRMFYRIRFQKLSHSDDRDEEKNLAAWQKPETLYILFDGIWKSALVADLKFFPFLRYLPKNGRILEYGCNTSPVVCGLIRYLPHRKYEFVIADILQINFVFSIYKLGKFKNVKSLLLTPLNNRISPDDKYDAIVCTAVLEHTPNPLEIVESFHKSLNKNGILIFDYVKSEGDGLDSKNSVSQRTPCLEYIEENFKIIKGKIDKNSHVGLVVTTLK